MAVILKKVKDGLGSNLGFRKTKVMVLGTNNNRKTKRSLKTKTMRKHQLDLVRPVLRPSPMHHESRYTTKKRYFMSCSHVVTRFGHGRMVVLP
jgi:hypothetical protein